jgi:hypothetical protein
MVEESDEEKREGCPKAKPVRHGDDGESHDHPTVIEILGERILLHGE